MIQQDSTSVEISTHLHREKHMLKFSWASDGGMNSKTKTSLPGSKDKFRTIPEMSSTSPRQRSLLFFINSIFTVSSWNTKAPQGSKRISNVLPGYSHQPTIRFSKSSSQGHCGPPFCNDHATPKCLVKTNPSTINIDQKLHVNLSSNQNDPPSKSTSSANLFFQHVSSLGIPGHPSASLGPLLCFLGLWF